VRRYPAFIVGSPRSGTSVLVDALLGAGYHGFCEGNFLSLYATLEPVIERHFAAYANGSPHVLASVVDQATLRRDIRDVFKNTTDALNRDVPWFDKTGNPEMLTMLPALKTMWPDAVFIFAKRRALENIASRLRKFPDYPFEYHCRDWARNMAVWHEVRPHLPDGCTVEIDQQDMIRQPAQVAANLAALLQLDADTTLAARTIFEHNRPQQTSDGSAVRIETLETLPWTPDQVAVFNQECGPQLAAYGYSTDDRYWR